MTTHFRIRNKFCETDRRRPVRRGRRCAAGADLTNERWDRWRRWGKPIKICWTVCCGGRLIFSTRGRTVVLYTQLGSKQTCTCFRKHPSLERKQLIISNNWHLVHIWSQSQAVFQGLLYLQFLIQVTDHFVTGSTWSCYLSPPFPWLQTVNLWLATPRLLLRYTLSRFTFWFLINSASVPCH